MHNIYADGRIDGEIGGSDDDDDFHPRDERECVGFGYSESPKAVCVGERDDGLNQPATAEGSSREGAIVIDDQTEADTEIDYEDNRPPWEDDTGTQMDNWLEGLGMSALEYLSEENPPAGLEDVINPEMVERVRT